MGPSDSPRTNLHLLYSHSLLEVSSHPTTFIDFSKRDPSKFHLSAHRQKSNINHDGGLLHIIRLS
jgi:hypothetical protein